MGYANVKQELIILPILALIVSEDAKNVKMVQFAKAVA